jgi:hypothetical protein
VKAVMMLWQVLTCHSTGFQQLVVAVHDARCMVMRLYLVESKP